MIRELGNIDKEKAKKISNIIENSYDLIKYRNLNYTKFYIPNLNTDLLELDIELLEFMLLYYLGEYKNALKYLKIFLEDKETNEYQYYYAIYDYVDLKWIKKMPTGVIKSSLDKKYSEELTRELFEDFNNPELIFQYYKFPNCYNCGECQLNNDCSILASLRIEKKIEEFSVKKIRQSDLLSEFEDVM